MITIKNDDRAVMAYRTNTSSAVGRYSFIIFMLDHDAPHAIIAPNMKMRKMFFRTMRLLGFEVVKVELLYYFYRK
jgi:hypothetical protein